MTRPRVLLADDYPGILRSLTRLLEPDCDIVGTVAAGHALLADAIRLRPDVIIVDLGLPEVDGLEIGRRLSKTAPEIRIIVISASNDEAIARAALQTPGVSAFLAKHITATHLGEAVRVAFAEAGAARGTTG